MGKASAAYERIRRGCHKNFEYGCFESWKESSTQKREKTTDGQRLRAWSDLIRFVTNNRRRDIVQMVSVNVERKGSSPLGVEPRLARLG